MARRPVRPGGKPRQKLGSSAIGGRSDLNHGFNSLEVVTQNEIDDASDGIRPVDGRSSVSDDFHPLDRSDWDHRNIDERTVVARRNSSAVDQNQGGPLPETSKVDAIAILSDFLARIGFTEILFIDSPAKFSGNCRIRAWTDVAPL